MPFEKGNRANPGGRPKEKPWREALTLALKSGDRVPLRAIADKVVELAMNGDMEAIKEIGNRLDGKPIQPNEHAGDGGGPIGIKLIWGGPERGLERTDRISTAAPILTISQQETAESGAGLPSASGENSRVHQ